TLGVSKIPQYVFLSPPRSFNLLGNIPYSASPPNLISRLRMITSWPASAILLATAIPAGPAPTTITTCVSSFDPTTFMDNSSFRCEDRPAERQNLQNFREL